MSYPSRPTPYVSRTQYAYQVYELLAANQVSEDLNYDGDRTITGAGVETFCHNQGTEITFPNPYTDEPATIVLFTWQPPTAVAAVVEALLTRYASHLAFVAAETAEARLRQEVD
jgi:hypothetical protein